ncbi:MAG TPA: glycosyltransferase 87 family protein [Vicinamibacteria bacterium]|nr:glycosyltransferase 87 family protein [Vicinamibacteria bacterium]
MDTRSDAAAGPGARDGRRAGPWPLALAVLALGLLAAPHVYHHYDVVDCFLAWSRASEGTRPWQIYLAEFPDDCDYPPVVPYLLTLVEAARRATGAAETGALAVTLLKLPSLLAVLAFVPLCLRGLRAPLGERAARTAALLSALGAPLFVNAALWGQFDALLALLLAAGLVALLNRRAAWAGAALGAALATKLLAVVALPAAAVWTWRRLGPRPLAVAVGTGTLAIALLAAPYLLAGAGPRMARAYTDAVGYYPFRTAEAYNGWYLLDRFDIAVRGRPAVVARRDDRPALGPLTHRDVGLLAFAAGMVFLMAGLWRHPTDYGLVWATAMSFFAFFMLPTQVHQRYLVPAAALLALAASRSRRWLVLFAGLAAAATLNQALDLTRAVLDHAAIQPGSGLVPPLYRGPIRAAASLVALSNVALFVWAMAVFRREMAAAPVPR